MAVYMEEYEVIWCDGIGWSRGGLYRGRVLGRMGVGYGGSGWGDIVGEVLGEVLGGVMGGILGWVEE